MQIAVHRGPEISSTESLARKAASTEVPTHRKIGKTIPPIPNHANNVKGIRAVDTTKLIMEGMVQTAMRPAPGKRKPRPAALKAGRSSL